MKKALITAAVAAVALAALTGCTTTPAATPEAGGTPTNIHTYAGNSTTPFTFTHPATAWEDLTLEARQDMIDTATSQHRALVIWGDHVEWTGLYPQAPAEQKQWVERMVERYAATAAPVVFVVGVGTDALHVERQNLEAPTNEQAIEKVTYNVAP